MFVADDAPTGIASVVRGGRADVTDSRDAHSSGTRRRVKTSVLPTGIYVDGALTVGDDKMVFDRVKEKLTGTGSGERDTDVVMPADSSVVKRTAKEVDLSSDEVEDAIKRFQEVGAMAFPVIDDKAVRGEGSTNVKEEETPSFLYAVHEDEEVLVVGGAKNILLSLADRLEMSNAETRAVTRAQRIAADANGFSEHMVMDDVFMVPKEKRFVSRFDGLEDVGSESNNGAADTLRDKMDGVREVEENGFVLQTPERFGEALNLDEKKYFGVTYGSDRDSLRLELDPSAGGEDVRHAVIQPNGNIHIPREIAVGLGVQHREVDWGMEDGKVVGVMEDGKVDADIVDTMRTSLVEDNVNEQVRAHLAGDHTRKLNIEEGDELAVYLEPDGDDFAIVATPHIFEAPTDAVVDVENIGKGTEMICFALPDEVADVLGVDDGKDRQVEWGIRGDELVGSVVRL